MIGLGGPTVFLFGSGLWSASGLDILSFLRFSEAFAPP